MAVRKQITCLQLLKGTVFHKDVLMPAVGNGCIAYQQRRHKRYYPKQRPQSEPWHLKWEAEPVLYDPLTEESREFLEDDFVKKHTSASPLRNEPWPRNEYTVDTRRIGVLAVKIGVHPLWKKDGTKIMTCLLQVIDNHVIRYIPPAVYQTYPSFNPKWLTDRGNWGSAVVGAISCNPWNLDEDYVKMFNRAGVPPKRRLTRFMVTPDAAVAPDLGPTGDYTFFDAKNGHSGYCCTEYVADWATISDLMEFESGPFFSISGTPLDVTHFNVGDYVDCGARTIDHGFQGVMKRWGFAGMPASHGTTKSHRRPGSLSSGRQKGLWKGSKLPGLMGDKWCLKKGLKIWRINRKYNVLYVTFGVPGPNHCFVRVHDSGLEKHVIKREENAQSVAMPTRYPDDSDDSSLEDIYDDELYQFDEDSITFGEEAS